MAVRIIWSPLARKDLKEVGAHIRKHNPSAAKTFLWSLNEKVELLVDFPELGRVVAEEEDPTVREVIYRSYRIVYLYASANKTIQIIRVWHSARGEPEFESQA